MASLAAGSCPWFPSNQYAVKHDWRAVNFT